MQSLFLLSHDPNDYQIEYNEYSEKKLQKETEVLGYSSSSVAHGFTVNQTFTKVYRRATLISINKYWSLYEKERKPLML